MTIRATRRKKRKAEAVPMVPAYLPFERYRWFVSCAVNWCADDNLETALKRLRADHKGFPKPFRVVIYRVPGPCEGTNYEIRFYAPMLESGAVRCGYVDFAQPMDEG